MNQHTNPQMAKAAAVDLSMSMVTASYAPDLERCRLLCETVDRRVEGLKQHYILVDGADLKLFRQLEGPHRTIVDERDILPSWLRAYWDPTSRFRRRIWLSLKTKPLRGWHVQQLRRIAIAAHTDVDILLYCDSDVAFVRNLGIHDLFVDGRLGLYRDPKGLDSVPFDDHRVWFDNAGKALGINARPKQPNDYISTLLPWRRKTVVDMCEHIERVNSRSWVQSIASERKFSECLIYGRYVDEVLGGAGHYPLSTPLSQMHWTGDVETEAQLRSIVSGMREGQFAFGVQSFLGIDASMMRKVIL